MKEAVGAFGRAREAVLVHTCEVIERPGRSPALSPTGRTIKVDGSKLRPSPLTAVCEEPVGPENASLAGDLDEAEVPLWASVSAALRRIRGGYGAE